MIKTKEQPEFLKYFKRATKKQIQELENNIRKDVPFCGRPEVVKQYMDELHSILNNIFVTVSSQAGGVDKYIEELESHLCDWQNRLEPLYPSVIDRQKCVIHILWYIHQHRETYGDLFKLIPYIATIRIGSHKINTVAYELFINIPDEDGEPRHVISFIDDDTWYIVEEFNRALKEETACPIVFTNRLEDAFHTL